MTFRRTHKIKLRPTERQKKKMLGWFELLRELYNAAIEERMNAWNICGKEVFGGLQPDGKKKWINRHCWMTHQTMRFVSKKWRTKQENFRLLLSICRLCDNHLKDEESADMGPSRNQTVRSYISFLLLWQYVPDKRSINYPQQSKQLTEIKKIRTELSEINSHVLQDALRKVDKAYKAFFRRVQAGEKRGYPRFKREGEFTSFTIPKCRFDVDGNRINISRLGSIKGFFKNQNRPIEGEMKSATITYEAGDWYVCIVCEYEADALRLPTKNRAIGIDMGIESFATLSDGTHIPNPRYYESLSKKLRVAQKRVSRRTKWLDKGQRRAAKNQSNRRTKAQTQAAKIHQKIARCRADFQHKLSTLIVDQYDLIAVEALNIKGLAKSRLAKQIHDASWGSFLRQLKYKAESSGKKLIEVDPKGTSQTCICGNIVHKSLSIRWHDCSKCGLSEHRDIVSAKVILQRALTREDDDKNSAEALPSGDNAGAQGPRSLRTLLIT